MALSILRRFLVGVSQKITGVEHVLVRVVRRQFQRPLELDDGAFIVLLRR